MLKEQMAYKRLAVVTSSGPEINNKTSSSSTRQTTSRKEIPVRKLQPHMNQRSVGLFCAFLLREPFYCAVFPQKLVCR